MFQMNSISFWLLSMQFWIFFYVVDFVFLHWERRIFDKDFESKFWKNAPFVLSIKVSVELLN